MNCRINGNRIRKTVWPAGFAVLLVLAGGVWPALAETRYPYPYEHRSGKGFDERFDSDFHRDIEDAVSIEQGDGELIAIVGGRSVFKADLDLNESVKQTESRGYLGVALTTSRLLAVSRSSPGWVEMPLTLDEKEADRRPDLRLSDSLLLVTTGKRIIGFDSVINQWIEIDLPLYDRFKSAAVDRFVAVAVTSDRVYGLAFRTSSFVTERFKKGEQFRSLNTSAHSVTIRTDRRLLIFQSSDAFWDEVDLD